MDTHLEVLFNSLNKGTSRDDCDGIIIYLRLFVTINSSKCLCVCANQYIYIYIYIYIYVHINYPMRCNLCLQIKLKFVLANILHL